MKSNYYIFKPCTTGAAFQGVVKKLVKIDMSKAKEILKKEGYEIKLSLKDMIIAKNKYTINIFKDGRVLVKEIKDEEKAKEIIKKIYEKLL
ncbi:MAG: hypothetical protein J7K73_03570 [Nanoarchaeota archaeon]|nr:hypothetical protein [Nanoarchaeota archaeon]